LLVLTRKVHQSIIVGDEVEIIVLEVRGEQVRLGIKAPKNVNVHRKEVYEQIAEHESEPEEGENLTEEG